MAKQNSPETAKVDIETFKNAIRALESPKAKRDRERATLFDALYDDIRTQLNAEVSKSAIVKTLADCGLSINMKVFDELLEAEAMRRGEPIPGKEADDIPAVASSNAPPASATKQETT
jgi:hypothetical protein